VAKLERLARAHRREQHDLEGRRHAAEAHAARLDALAGVCEEAAGRRVDTRADRFAMVVDDRRYTSRVDAGVALRNALLANLDDRPAAAGTARSTRSASSEVSRSRSSGSATAWTTGAPVS